MTLRLRVERDQRAETNNMGDNDTVSNISNDDDIVSDSGDNGNIRKVYNILNDDDIASNSRDNHGNSIKWKTDVVNPYLRSGNMTGFILTPSLSLPSTVVDSDMPPLLRASQADMTDNKIDSIMAKTAARLCFLYHGAR